VSSSEQGFRRRIGGMFENRYIMGVDEGNKRIMYST
jgi:hypothetical protein